MGSECRGSEALVEPVKNNLQHLLFGSEVARLGIPQLGLMLLRRWDGRVARPCEPRVRNGRCPASALKCFETGPLGDTSVSVSLVLASVNVSYVVVSSYMWRTLCESFVK